MILEVVKNIDPITKLLGDWLFEINIFSILIRLFLAILFGGLIGGERATKKQAAGLRTYILVCAGACIVMITNQFIYESFDTGDAARLGAQVISGIGFLGAGAILVTSRNQIKGLTTAAGLWACACMGLSIGIGFYTLSLFGFIVILIVLTLLPKLESLVNMRAIRMEIHIELDTRHSLKSLVEFLREKGITIISLEHNQAYSSSGLSVYTIFILLPDKKFHHKDFLIELKELDFVNYVEELFK